MTLVIVFIIALIGLGVLAMINEYGKGNILLEVGGFIMLVVGLMICLLLSILMIG